MGAGTSLALGGALGAGGKAISGAMADGALKGAATEATKTGLTEATKTGLTEASSNALGGATVEGGIGAVKSGLGDAVSTGIAESAGQVGTDAATQGIASTIGETSASAMGGAAPSVALPGVSATPSYGDLSMGDKWTLAKDYNNPQLGLAALALHGQKQTLEDERLAEEEDARDTTRARKRGRQIWDQGMDRSQYHFAEGGAVPEARAFQPIFDFKSYTPPNVQWDGSTGGSTTAPGQSAPTATLQNTPRSARDRLMMSDMATGAPKGKDAENRSRLAAIATAAMEKGQITDPYQSWSPYQFAMWNDHGRGYPTLHNNRRTAGDMQAMFAKGYAEGGHVQGPGDGMSDGIGALIDGVEPARIASGEYIIPADVVSHLGNGDTNAGVEYLNTQLAAIRKDSTGNPNQRKKIDPTKYIG